MFDRTLDQKQIQNTGILRCVQDDDFMGMSGYACVQDDDFMGMSGYAV
jgi:hypothetical protein